MHLLPDSISDACVHQLKGVSWLATNLSGTVLFQQLRSHRSMNIARCAAAHTSKTLDAFFASHGHPCITAARAAQTRSLKFID